MPPAYNLIILLMACYLYRFANATGMGAVWTGEKVDRVPGDGLWRVVRR